MRKRPETKIKTLFYFFEKILKNLKNYDENLSNICEFYILRLKKYY